MNEKNLTDLLDEQPLVGKPPSVKEFAKFLEENNKKIPPTATLLEYQLFLALTVLRTFVNPAHQTIPDVVDTALKAFEDKYINIVKWEPTVIGIVATYKAEIIGSIRENVFPRSEAVRWVARIFKCKAVGGVFVKANFPTRHEAEDWVETYGKPQD